MGGVAMLNQLLPQRMDNAYLGSKWAIWLLLLLVLMKGAMGLNCIINGHLVASSADGIPLDTYTPAGERAVVSLFAIWGLSQLLFSLLGLLVVIRYRAMVPLMFALFLLEHLSRRLILQVMPIAKVGTPPGGFVNLGLLTLMIVGLILSLWNRDWIQASKPRIDI
jgi:hypothetical protein